MAGIDTGLLALIGDVADGALGSSDMVALGRAVARLSARYTTDRGALSDVPEAPGALSARLRFFLPRDLPKVHAPLEELHQAGVFPGSAPLRVLDVGAGLGAMSLGIATFVARWAHPPLLRVTALDQDERGLGLLSALLSRLPEAGLPRLEVETRRGELSPEPDVGGPYDLIVLGFVLNELEGWAPETRARLLGHLTTKLAPDGALLVLEPALRTTTRALQTVRDRIVADPEGPRVFAPCLHVAPCPMLARDRDWCHQERATALPPPVAEVARRAGLRGARLTWSHLTLRPRSAAPASYRVPDGGACYRVVSAPRPTKGKLELTGCGANGLVTLARLTRHVGTANAALAQVARGDVLEVDAHAEDGSRLRVGPNTRVAIRYSADSRGVWGMVGTR